MQHISELIAQYLAVCTEQKNLNAKTIKAYRIDLHQFQNYLQDREFLLTRESVTAYVMSMHKQFKPKSVKRKVASLKAFCHFLVEENLLETDPFQQVHIKYKEPLTLPRTIPIRLIEQLLSSAHQRCRYGNTKSERKTALRDVCVLELLFATGVRVSELCSLNIQDIDLVEGNIWIYGKGAKERRIQVGSAEVLLILQQYYQTFSSSINDAFFLNRNRQRLSEQSVRLIIRKYSDLAGIDLHITPHMFRHSFATLLLEEDVDIRYIQQFLGHSSIVTTQIYTHVATAKQRDILANKHPRKKMIL